MTCVIRMHSPEDIEGQYLKEFDFDAMGGKGFGVFTADVREAMRFDRLDDAWKFWSTISKVKPLRADGKPNRPLTASTIEVVRLREEKTT